ncbi:hypothetical protein BGZ97_005158 [Linnemannia gamsii]|uniref:Uncharacterized protein n=1 Tax=Linnemannia gamsii TaxID=64522 RepID=A0A9P6QST1_9FUNG|nr:hypothetical protein BGZ97_005158 [Linnemannia gamsii]
MSQPCDSPRSLKRAYEGESPANKPKQRRRVKFNTSETTIPGTSDITVPVTSDTTTTVTSTSDITVSDISDSAVPSTSISTISDTFDTTVASTSNSTILDTSDITVTNMFDTLVHEELPRSSSSSPTIRLPKLLRNGAEIFAHLSGSDISVNTPKPTTSQSTSRCDGYLARPGSSFIPQYAPQEPSHEELKNTTIHRDQSFNSAFDSELDMSNSDEDNHSDKEDEDPVAPQPNRTFRESREHPPKYTRGTESKKPVGSSFVDCPFPLGYQPRRQEVDDRVNRFNGDNMPFDKRPPFSGPSIHSERVSNGHSRDHVQEASEEDEGLEGQNGLKTLMIDSMKAIKRHNESLKSSASSYRQRFNDETRQWPERLLYQQEAKYTEDKVYNNCVLILSHLKLMSGDKSP